MTWSGDARPLWHQVYPELSNGAPGLLEAVTSRAEAQVTRLACVYALLDRSAVIERVHLEAALALWSYCADSAQYIFGDRLGYPLADEILQALRSQPEGLTRWQIRRLLGHHVKSVEIDQALQFLAKQGLAGFEVEQTEGRPAERWRAVGKKAKYGKKAARNGIPEEWAGAPPGPGTAGGGKETAP
jgi:hypothetical protein